MYTNNKHFSIIVIFISLLIVIIGGILIKNNYTNNIEKPALTNVYTQSKSLQSSINEKQWQKFTSDISNFSILFPQNPEYSSVQNDSIIFDSYKVTLPNTTRYEVYVKSYPENFNDLTYFFNENGIDILYKEYNEFSENYIKTRKEKIKDDEMFFKVGELTGYNEDINILNFSANSEKITILGQFIFANSKLYRLTYMANKTHFNQKDYDKFVSSFILNQKPDNPLKTPQ